MLSIADVLIRIGFIKIQAGKRASLCLTVIGLLNCINLFAVVYYA